MTARLSMRPPQPFDPLEPLDRESLRRWTENHFSVLSLPEEKEGRMALGER